MPKRGANFPVAVGLAAHSLMKAGQKIMTMQEAVYLLHFRESIFHAQHYLGSTNNLSDRLRRHRAGNGARLPQVFAERGVTFTLARVWLPADARAEERRLKARKNGRKLCPLCCNKGLALASII